MESARRQCKSTLVEFVVTITLEIAVGGRPTIFTNSLYKTRLCLKIFWGFNRVWKKVYVQLFIWCIRYPTLCTSLFASNPHAQKVDIQQWAIIAMQSAESAVNESYSLIVNMEKGNSGNSAYMTCQQVMADSLDQVNTSMYLVADMDPSSPGTTLADVQTYMSAAMTDQDTCQQGISEVGGWPGSDSISGARADHVNSLLSISLTFVNALQTSGNHHRRLLVLDPHAVGSILGRRGLLSLQNSRRTWEPLHMYKSLSNLTLQWWVQMFFTCSPVWCPWPADGVLKNFIYRWLHGSWDYLFLFLQCFYTPLLLFFVLQN